MTGNCKIPYGISSFTRLRAEGYYYVDKSVPSFAHGTTLHQIVFQFRGSELVRMEQIAEEIFSF